MGSSWPSPVLVMLRNPSESPLPSRLNENEISLIVSVSFLASLFTTAIMGFLVKHIGKKQWIILGYVPKIICSFMFLFASRYWMLLVGRIFNGVSDIFFLNIVAPYAAEIASKEVRGALGTISQVLSSLGMLIMYSVGPNVSYFVLNLTYTSIVIITLIPILYLPESPYFLYSRGRNDEAFKVLKFFRVSETVALAELNEYATEKNGQLNAKALIKNKLFIKGTILGTILGLGTQLVGYNCMAYYLQTILVSTKTSVEPATASVVVGVLQLLGSLFSSLVIDRFGRKPILACTSIGMALGMMGLGVFFKIMESNEESIFGFMNYLPLISLGAVVLCFNSGIGSLYLLLFAELLDSSVRMIGTCICVFCSTLMLFILSSYFGVLITIIGSATTFWIYSANCLAFCAFVMICVPETKNKTFSEIQEALSGSNLMKE